jgi:hypothetical protein
VQQHDRRPLPRVVARQPPVSHECVHGPEAILVL